MPSKFRKATKSQARLRLALIGPSGGGKTFSALAIATGLAGPSGRIAVIDTERGSASKYSDRFAFDVLELDHFDPRNYIDAIESAEAEGYAVLVVDSLSHAWIGRGGELEMVDAAAKRSRSNNSYTAWREVTPLHNQLVDSIIRSGCHVIATMRSKVDYVLQPDANGKLQPKKVGMAPIQREGMDYEFDVVADLDLDHNLIVGKTRCAEIDGLVEKKPGEGLGKRLAAWLSDGAAMPERAARIPYEEPARAFVPPTIAPGPPAAAAHEGGSPAGSNEQTASEPEPTIAPPTAAGPPPSSPSHHKRIMYLVSGLGMTDEQFVRMLHKRGVETVVDLTGPAAVDLIRKLEDLTEAANPAAHVLENIRDSQPQGEVIEAGPVGPESIGPADGAEDHVIADVQRREKAEKPPKGGKARKAPGQAAASDEILQEALAN